jgi:hypothetical protein
VLYFKGEHRLKVLEKGVMKRIFGPKRDEVTGGWRKLHNEERYHLGCSLSKIRTMKTKKTR